MKTPANITRIPKNSKLFKEHVALLPGWTMRHPLMEPGNPGSVVDDEVITAFLEDNEQVSEVIFHQVQQWYAIKLKSGVWYQWGR